MTANNDNKVLACVDQSAIADCVTDCAAWAAQRLSAPLELLHVLDRHAESTRADDHSGAIGMDAQEVLLNQLSSADEVRSRTLREQGRVFLNRLRERALATGLGQVDMRQRHGDLQQTLSEQEDSTRLLVLGRRGESAEIAPRNLGRNVERVIRNLRKPILTVTMGFAPPQRALIAFDGGNMSRRAVELIASSPLLRGLPLQVVMAGEASAAARRRLDWAKQRLVEAGFDASVALLAGDPEQRLAHSVREQGIGLLVMGAYSHSPLRGLLFGSRTNELLRSAQVPTLLVR